MSNVIAIACYGVGGERNSVPLVWILDHNDMTHPANILQSQHVEIPAVRILSVLFIHDSRHDVMKNS